MSIGLPARTPRPVAGHDLRYDRAATAAAATVIRTYSTSFGLACRLLDQPVRDHVRNVYALVRLADEIVDGALGVNDPGRAGEILDSLEQDTAHALREGYSANLVVHAFAQSARACRVEGDLVAPFFSSMRADLSVRDHDAASFKQYVHGSAEVVGLMCLRIFLADDGSGSVTGGPGGRADGEYADLAAGARQLGAAFQKINFLRDLDEDHRLRGRRYFPGVDPDHLAPDEVRRILDDIDADLAVAAAAARRLPRSSRRAVAVAQALFTELAARLRATPAASIQQTRVRVPAPVKAAIVARVLLRADRR